MRPILIGMAALLAAIFLYHFAYQHPTNTAWGIGARIVIAAFAIVIVGYYLLRQRRLHTWARAEGRIESCRKVRYDEGVQEYECTYLFSVDGARQAGSFRLRDQPDQLEEIKAALVGEQVNVRYDPGDCTKCIIEEEQIKGWDVIA